jgi:2-oxoglutarate ferredoxin oxidoreductase subunit alpha
MSITTEGSPASSKEHVIIEGATVRLAGDSGDGMQVVGTEFTNTSALHGNDVATFPDFPAEIRAPRGTRAGVSGFQVQFASTDIFTPGDTLHALVCMNAAALITNIADLQKGGILIVNTEGFKDKDLKLARLDSNPLEDGTVDDYRVFEIPLETLNRETLKDVDLSTKLIDRCKNFFALGLIYWLYGRELDATLRYISTKYGGKPAVVEANEKALKAGWYFGETTEAFVHSYKVDPAQLKPGKYKNIMGNQALAWGLITAARLSGKELFYGSYPITPASPVLEELSRFKHFGVRTFQAEDEIAAICSAIGAAFGGAMALTGSSGPGICLKGEAMGLGMILELPMIILNVQRGGPSTGLPTKTEQSDLMLSIFGRNGESPLPVIAARSPSDCFDVAQEAWRIATRFMTPVILLSDGYIANGSEPWSIPDFDDLPRIEIQHAGPQENGDEFLPYSRNERLARPWAVPGTPGLMHRVGGLEKEDGTGNVSYDPANHQNMTNIRAQKVANIADDIPLQEVQGPENGDVLVLTWGGTYGACTTAVKKCQASGVSVAHAHLRYMNPFPKNLGDILDRYQKILIPELNMGQLRLLVSSCFTKKAIGLNKVEGKPFTVAEVAHKIQEVANAS